MTALDSRAQLKSWAKRLQELDYCPWPGPRPLNKGDSELLVGRDEDRRRFRHEVDSHRLIVLAGVSGAGKTSLLDAGLQPELEASGYTVAVCRDWGRDAKDQQAAVDFLADKVRSALPKEDVLGLPAGGKFFWSLKEKYDDRLVVVLDQFEELIRFDRALKDSVVDLLVEVNRRLPLKIIISLRSEYLHELRDFESRAMPFTVTQYVLQDVAPEFAEGVVLAPNRDRSGGARHIEDDLALDIAHDWRRARETSQAEIADPFGRIGLLHLQALLYSLHATVGGGTVVRSAYARMKQEATESANPNVFTYGVVRAIDVKLGRCEQTFSQEGVDSYRLAGVQSLLVRAVPKLASGGYKLVRGAHDLLDEILEAEMGVLFGALTQARQEVGDDADGPPTPEQLRALKDVVVLRSVADDIEMLDVPPHALAREADARHLGPVPWSVRLHPGAVPAAADPMEVSCGPVAGLAPAVVLIEELRRYALMLTWLGATNLVRMTTPAGNEVMISLIHDGFGEGLRQWAEGRRRDEPAADALHALTAPFGAFFDWSDVNSDIFDGSLGHRVFANLRWRGDTVRATFRRVAFVNCDFRGTLFDSCVFDGVTLVNCRLDGTLLSDCTITGELGEAEVPVETFEPQFVVEAPLNRLLPAMRYYQDLELSAGSVFRARHVGRPAVPATPGDLENIPRAELAAGGLVILGGRLSALTVRNTTFSPGSRLSFRQVAGSGLDLVEQSSGHLDVLGCAVRHLAVTGPADQSASNPYFELTIRGSLLAQGWIGDTIRGKGVIDNCRLVQFWNGSDDMVVTAKGTNVISSYGVQTDRNEIRTADDDIAQAARRMDYTRLSQAYDSGDRG